MESKTINNVDWMKLVPDENNDWINQRDKSYESFTPFIKDKSTTNGIFLNQFTGVYPARDNWVVGFSRKNVISNSKIMVENYNNELVRLKNVSDPKERMKNVNKAENFIKWSRGLTKKFETNQEITLDEKKVVLFMHRPFTKKWMFYEKNIIEMPSRYQHIFRNMGNVLYLQGQGSKKEFSCIATNLIPNLQLIHNGKGFPMYAGRDSLGLVSNISEEFTTTKKISNEEVFYLIYAVLHSKEYKEKFANDLSKNFPRIPNLKDKQKFI
ncbi:MAG: type ISP restriction/modification enzyme [Psychrobacillus psychrodurans]